MMRRVEQCIDRSRTGLRQSLLKDRSSLKPEAAAEPDALTPKLATVCTARGWAYKKQLRENLGRKQIRVVRANLEHCCTCVMRSNVEPMTEVAAHVRRRLERTVARAQTRQTNGLFQAAKRRACRFTSLSTTKTAIVGELEFHAINPQARQSTWISKES